jgi:hypothetical protein
MLIGDLRFLWVEETEGAENCTPLRRRVTQRTTIVVLFDFGAFA